MCPKNAVWKKAVHAISENNLDEFEKVISGKRLEDIRSENGDTLLHFCVRQDVPFLFIEKLFRTLSFFSIDVRNNDNKTPLHDAAQCKLPLWTKFLLEQGADVNALKKADWTPLMLACTKVKEGKCFSTCTVLLEHKALVNFPNKDGWMPLHISCREGDIDIFQLLIYYGAKYDVKTKNKRTCLHIAALHGNFELVKLISLLDIRMVQEEDDCGYTPLHDGIISGNMQSIDLLIFRGGKVNKQTKEGFNTLHLAASRGHIEVATYLIKEHNVNPNSTSNSLFTPLHMAAKNKDKGMYNHLISLGANPDLLDECGRKAEEYFQEASTSASTSTSTSADNCEKESAE